MEDKNPKDDPEFRNKLDEGVRKTNAFAQYSSLGFQMLGTIGLGVWGGVKLDEWQGNEKPLWTIVLSLVAIGASLYLFIRGLPKP
ncbi:AtpZ/AtpI family protein [Larkinella soli]|uniref:AtpZ/AtpI family protein n=1 Tax=Larkinella soli TaxID=1770527 RepID=UPI000FFB1043|nr:AtpZ/AtpI family protein [Larkinella soli]